MDDPLVSLIKSMTLLRRQLRELNDVVEGIQQLLRDDHADPDDQGPRGAGQDHGDGDGSESNP